MLNQQLCQPRLFYDQEQQLIDGLYFFENSLIRQRPKCFTLLEGSFA